MEKYIKRPVEIDAVQFLGFMKVDDTRTDTLFITYPEWLMKALRGGPIQYIDPNVLAVNTLEGRMIISKDIFEMSYDPYRKTLGGMLDEQS